MKSFPSLLRLLLVVGLCVVVDGHNYLRGGGDTRKLGVRRFRMRRRMMMMMMMKRKDKGPEPTPQAETLPPRRKRNTTTPGRFQGGFARETLPPQEDELCKRPQYDRKSGRFQDTDNLFERAKSLQMLQVNMTGPAEAESDEIIRFSIIVSNNQACWDARNTFVEDALPLEGDFVASYPEGTVENSTLKIRLGRIDAGKTKQAYVLWRTPDHEAMITNHACADASNAEVTPDCEVSVLVDAPPCSKTEPGIECCTDADCVDEVCNSSNQCECSTSVSGIDCCTDADCDSEVCNTSNQCECSTAVPGVQCCTDADCADEVCSSDHQCACSTSVPGVECCTQADCNDNEVCSIAHKCDCPKDTKTCPDGRVIDRDPANNCEFPSCSETPVCTADVKECPDGSYVSRDPTNHCNFAPCPCPDGHKVCPPDDTCFPEYFECPCPGGKKRCSPGEQCVDESFECPCPSGEKRCMQGGNAFFCVPDSFECPCPSGQKRCAGIDDCIPTSFDCPWPICPSGQKRCAADEPCVDESFECPCPSGEKRCALGGNAFFCVPENFECPCPSGQKRCAAGMQCVDNSVDCPCPNGQKRCAAGEICRVVECCTDAECVVKEGGHHVCNASNQCQDDYSNFVLTNVMKFLDTCKHHHQRCALLYLMSMIDSGVYEKFTCDFQGRSSPCGPNLDLEDASDSYKSNSPPQTNQVDALNELQSTMETQKPSEWKQFIDYWREHDPCPCQDSWCTETQVNIFIAGDPAKIGEQEIKHINQAGSFVNLYNSWSDNYCDPYFRSIRSIGEVELVDLTPTNATGDGRFLQPDGRWERLKIKVRNKSNHGEKISAFGPKSRRRDLSVSSHGARFMQPAFCECPQDKEQKEPNEDDFLVEYNSKIVSLNIPNVDGIEAVVEPDVFNTTLQIEMVVGPEVTEITWNGIIKFNINIVNTGAWTATNVLLVDELPNEGSFMSSNPTGVFDGSILTVELGDLVPGEEVQVKVRWLTTLETEFLATVATVSADNAEETSKETNVNLDDILDGGVSQCTISSIPGSCCNDAFCGDTNLNWCKDSFCAPIDCGTAECCSDSDCSSGNQTCVSNVCISKGNPRFMLTWYGEDDLDIHVITPGGFHIYWLQPNDSTSGGELDHDDTPQAIDRHVENIAFPSVGAPTGTYQYYVRSLCRSCNGDEWKISVFLGDVEQDDFIQEGTGDSAYFNFTL